MKRVKAACILQTLIFMQKEDAQLSKEEALKLNTDEFERYIESLKDSDTKYSIDEKEETADGSVIIKIRKQYSSSTPTGEYFE